MINSTQRVDPRQFRETLGHYPTGVALVTAIVDGEPIGMVVGSFTSVSLDPPLIAYLPKATSATFAKLRQAESFCVNVLAHDQGDLCQRWASGRGGKFADDGWTPAPSGAPIIEGVVAWIDCTVESIVESGDHYIVIGRVHHLEVGKPVAPLLFFQGGYGRFAPLTLVAPAEPDLIAGVRLAEIARTDMEELATELGAEVSAISAVNSQLAVLATSTGPGATATQTLGSRIPLIPPLGELYVAWEGQAVADRWLASASATDEFSRAEYENRLLAARRRGWSMSLTGASEQHALRRSLQEYSEGEFTPAREREIRREIAGASKYYAPVELRDGELYDVNSLIVPVEGADGHVQLVLRVGQLPQQASGGEIQRWVDRMLLAASRTQSRIAATSLEPRALLNR